MSSFRRILIITMGDANVDLISSVESLPAEGEEACVRQLEMHLGGSAVNVAVGASRLGVRSGFVGKIGGDLFGRFLTERLQKEGVDISQLRTGDEASSGLIFSMITKDGERTMFAFRGANTYLSPEEIDESYIRSAKMFHLSGYSLLRNPQRKAALKALEAAREGGLSISLDPGLLTSRDAAHHVRSILKHVNQIFLDKSEAKQLIGGGPKNAARKLLKLGPEIVVLKLGAKGCFVLTEKKCVSATAFNVRAVDTTGAGDAFDAGFLVGLGEKWDLERIAQFANAVGALQATKVGGTSAIPTRREVERFIEGEKKAS